MGDEVRAHTDVLQPLPGKRVAQCMTHEKVRGIVALCGVESSVVSVPHTLALWFVFVFVCVCV